MKLSKTARIAAFLDFWAQEHPYDFAQYNEVLKAIEGFGYMPRLENKECDGVRSRCYGAGRILRRMHQRELIRHPGLGVRATVDAMDKIRHVQTKKIARVEGTIKEVVDVDEHIDLKTIPDTPENRPLKQWYQRDMRAILRQLASPEVLARMLPPPPPDPEGAGNPATKKPEPHK
jgi:hypothetical protein